MSVYHLLNPTHSYQNNVFVAVFLAATCSLRSMNQCVVIELLVWLLDCCCGYLTGAPKLARKCEIKHWWPCGADGRSLARSVYGHVITKFSRMVRLS